MIPVLAAIEEGAWILIDNSGYQGEGRDDDRESAIRQLKFRFRPTKLTQLDPSSARISSPEHVDTMVISECIWILEMDFVNLQKTPIPNEKPVLNQSIVMCDSDGFVFPGAYDIHIFNSSYSFGADIGLKQFHGSPLNPKVKYKGVMLFELPDELEDLHFIAPYGTINEA